MKFDFSYNAAVFCVHRPLKSAAVESWGEVRKPLLGSGCSTADNAITGEAELGRVYIAVIMADVN